MKLIEKSNQWIIYFDHKYTVFSYLKSILDLNKMKWFTSNERKLEKWTIFAIENLIRRSYFLSENSDEKKKKWSSCWFWWKKNFLWITLISETFVSSCRCKQTSLERMKFLIFNAFQFDSCEFFLSNFIKSQKEIHLHR